jgi:hypothetical protein
VSAKKWTKGKKSYVVLGVVDGDGDGLLREEENG